MTDLPTGTVTYLFTDIEGSTALWEQHPEAARAASPALIQASPIRRAWRSAQMVDALF